jgi:hypothetical protein
MIEATLSSNPGSHREIVAFGMKVRYSRIQIKMSAEQAGILYAKAISRPKPYTARRMEQMELKDEFPQDQARRWAIARIVQLSLFFSVDSEFEIPLTYKTPVAIKKKRSRGVDTQEYETTLRNYWENGANGELAEAIVDITERMCNLHDCVLYLRGATKKKMLRMLCAYNLLAAQTTEEKREYALSQMYLNRAIILARENDYPDLRATALQRRASFALDSGRFADALRDYQATLQLKAIPLQLQGRILSNGAEAKASLAHSQTEVEEAVTLLDTAEGMFGKDTLDDFGYISVFDEVRYLLNRGSTYISSPLRKLRSPDKALEYLPQVSTALDLAHWQVERQIHNHVVQAWAYLDQVLYTVATTLAEDALTLVERIGSEIHLNDLAELCGNLKQSPYGNSTEVAMLEIGIVRKLQPELFN